MGLQLKVFLAGRVAVEFDGVVIDEGRFPGRQGRLLFAYLVAEQGRPVPRDELAEALWEESLPATWDKALTVVVSKLRGLLADLGLDGATALTSAFGCYRLELPDESWVDVIVAVNAAEEADEALAAGDLDEAKAAAALAASLVRQPFLPGENGAWVERKRRELADVRGRALTALADACLRSGDAAEAVKWAEQAIALAPYRETGYRRLMDAHTAAGDRAEALRVYERCRRLLAEELGAYPSPETESIYRGLLTAPAAAAGVVAGSQPPAPDATPLVSVEHELEASAATGRRLVSRRRVGALAVAITVIAAAVAGILAIRGAGETQASAVAANAIGLIDADSERVRGQVVVDAAPTSVASGHGAIWVTNANGGTVSRIDPATRTVRQTITVGSSPSGIAVGAGAVWVANHFDGTVSRIEPNTNTVVDVVPVGNSPTAIAFGAGSLWVTSSSDRTVLRIDPARGRVVRKIRTDAVGRGIAVGGGSVWVTDESSRSIVRIDPKTNTVVETVNVGNGPTGIAFGAGAVWVANSLDGTVSRIDPVSTAVTATLAVGDGPGAVAAGPGVVWVAAEFDQRLVRIDTDAADPKIAGGLAIGNRPKGVVVSSDGVWVAVQASENGHRGGRLIATLSYSYSIDPSSSSNVLIELVYDGLTGFRRVGGSEGTQLVPNLARSIPAARDGGRSYTFRLRPGIRYSNGRLVRPEDFRRSLERAYELGGFIADPATAALTAVLGGDSCSQGRRCDLSRGVVTRGDTVTFRLSRPAPLFLFELSNLHPVPPGTPSRDVQTRPVPGTGTYAIESNVPERQAKLVRNPHFRVWSAAARPAGYPDEIVFRFAATAQAVKAVSEGKADVLLELLPQDEVEEVRLRNPRQLHFLSTRRTMFLFLDTTQPPFSDIRVRRAVNYAIDRGHLVELGGGTALRQPTCQVIPPAVLGYTRYCPYTLDPLPTGEWTAPDLNKAERLIDASGTRGQEVIVWTWPVFGKEGRYVVSLLRRLGYRARLEEREAERYFSMIVNPETRPHNGIMGFLGWQHGSQWINVSSCGYPSNLARFCDRGVDSEAARALKLVATDPEGAARIWARIDRELVDQAAWVPLFNPRWPTLVSKRVGNWQNHPQLDVLLDQLWVR